MNFQHLPLLSSARVALTKPPSEENDFAHDLNRFHYDLRSGGVADAAIRRAYANDRASSATLWSKDEALHVVAAQCFTTLAFSRVFRTF